MTNSYKSAKTTVNKESKVDLNTAFFEETLKTEILKKTFISVNNTRILSCKKNIFSIIKRKLNTADAFKHKLTKRREKAAITKVLIIDLNSDLKTDPRLVNNQNHQSVNLNSEQFAFVGDIFYCYI